MNIQLLANKLPDISLMHDDLEGLLTSDYIDVYWKNTEGAYLGVSEQFLHFSNMHSYDEVIGKTDAELIWRNQASTMMKNDQEVIRTKQNRIYVESALSHDGKINQFLSLKRPFHSTAGKLIGTYGLSVLLNEKTNIHSALDMVSCIIDPFNLRKNKLIAPTSTHNLTPQQFKCLLHLVKGMTIRQIATTLELSPKTVEHYLDAVKTKLNCSSRSELISKALQFTEIRERL